MATTKRVKSASTQSSTSYTAWQRAKLRRWLMHYQTQQSASGTCSVKVIHNRLVLCPETSQHYGRNGEAPELKEEALRRFMKGTTPLDDTKLNDIKLFLFWAGTISESDLEEIDSWRDDALKALSLFGQQNKSAKSTLMALAQRYITGRLELLGGDQRGGSLEGIYLDLTIDAGGFMVFVEEHYQYRALIFDPNDRVLERDRYMVANATHYGYGFILTDQNALCLFLRRTDTNSTILYLQVSGQELIFNPEESAVLHLLRSGTLRLGTVSVDAVPEPLNYVFSFQLRS